ncbi:MAG: helix-turn-helix domain-containing protein [bacterium]|nr:helix-turn-helix domain-containing protein [bacterium]
MSKIKNQYQCALVLTHDLIGGKWKLRILWHIFQGDNRFSMLVRAIPEITQKVLSSQLRELEESGILIKQIISEKPPRITLYQINEEYMSLIPIIESICEFTRQYGKNNKLEIKA